MQACVLGGIKNFRQAQLEEKNGLTYSLARVERFTIAVLVVSQITLWIKI